MAQATLAFEPYAACALCPIAGQALDHAEWEL
jgi:hypothetical protein